MFLRKEEKLIFKFLPLSVAPQVFAHLSEVNTAEGETSDLHCTVKASPAARIYWTKNGQKLHDTDKYKIHIHPHTKHHHNITTLRIRNVNKNDLGRYDCHAENDLGKHDVNVTLIYEPEVAIMNECRVIDEVYTVRCNWTVHSIQSVSEGSMFYKAQGDRKWLHDDVKTSVKKVEDRKWE